MDAAVALAVGQAITYILRKKHHTTRVIISKDTRISDTCWKVLESGVTSMGVCLLGRRAAHAQYRRDHRGMRAPTPG